ncbi:MAG: organic solvent tolerance protein OstA [Planctomycetota bacterium]
MRLVIVPLLIGLSLAMPARAQAQVRLPDPSPWEAVSVWAESGCRWQQDGHDVWMLTGAVRIHQGDAVARSDEAVLWVRNVSPLDPEPNRLTAYLEGRVAIERDRGKLEERVWFGHFESPRNIGVQVAKETTRPGTAPPLWQRALARWEASARGPAQAAQFTGPNGTSVAPITSVAPSASPSPPITPIPDPSLGGPGSAPGAALGLPNMGTPPVPSTDSPLPPLGARRIRAFPRSNVDVQFNVYPDPNSNQWIAVITSGVNLLIDGVPGYGTLDISADRIVIWTTGQEESDLSEIRQDQRVPLELYMEGNIVFRQGERVIQADRMYYDVTNQVGTVLGAEVLTPVPEYDGLLRLRADVLQQNGEGRFFAQDAFVTSSRMGRPGYRVQVGDIEFQESQFPVVDPLTGQPIPDPETGEPLIGKERRGTARNNVLFLGPVPVFYWPVLATNFDDPTFYIRRARVKNDQVYGFQVLTDWSAYEIFGIENPPAGTDWEFSIDWLGKRGLGHGTTFSYARDDFLGIPGPVHGIWDYWGIKDDGHDNLGAGRRNLVPEVDYRYRLFGQHRQRLSPNWQVTAEVGWISDRNFLESFFEREWDELKDQTTGLELKRTIENRSLSLSADLRVNDFFTQTEWLPRLDHFWIGQPLLRDAFTWYEHSSAAYARFQKLEPPSNPADQPFNFLPWETDSRQGERFVTRQEIDWPILLGPVKVVPYALGELAHWGEDINGDDLQRAYGQVGIRGSLPFWTVNPYAESSLWNVHGVAHKAEVQAEFFVADSTAHIDQLPLYDPLDDDSIEAFRRRLTNLTFGVPSPFPAVVGAVPLQFDERYYALRSGLASWVTSPSTEIADDLMVARLGLNQRWQTKRGLPGNRHIIDWITLDTGFSLFPKEERDNFGESIGLWDYDFRWHIGDRLTLVSDGILDFFDRGQQIVSVGTFLNRPPRGNLYVGFRVLEGPISSQVLTASYSYWMSPKWISSFGMSVDLKNQDNIGQNFTVTRVGESLLISAAVTVDAARDNVGVGFAIEPRFLPKTRLGQVGGARIPPAGAFGLE